jgi:hypothetical protein
MTAIALPPPKGMGVREIKTFHLYAVTFLIFSLLVSLNLSLSRTEAKRDCEFKQGPFSSGFSRGFDTGRCECSDYLHFAEACPTPAMFAPQVWSPPL